MDYVVQPNDLYSQRKIFDNYIFIILSYKLTMNLI